MRGWKRIKYSELDQVYQVGDHDYDVDKDGEDHNHGDSDDEGWWC